MQPNEFKVVNPHGELLTVEKLRTFKGFEEYSDTQAQTIVEALNTLAAIIVRTSLTLNNKPNPETQSITLNPNNQQIEKAA